MVVPEKIARALKTASSHLLGSPRAGGDPRTAAVERARLELAPLRGVQPVAEPAFESLALELGQLAPVGGGIGEANVLVGRDQKARRSRSGVIDRLADLGIDQIGGRKDCRWTATT